LEKGELVVRVYTDTIAIPMKGAVVHIYGPSTNIILTTDAIGSTIVIDVDAPDVAYSLTPQYEVLPFSLYTIEVSKEGYANTIIQDVEVYSGVQSIQEVYLQLSSLTKNVVNVIEIDPPALWNPPEVYYQTSQSTILPTTLPMVVIPQYIIVYDGTPTNTTAPNYYVPFVEYIKNVACSEIYATWPSETIKANVHAIVSFTLNRVYTEWYRSLGYTFTVTSLPAYDQKYTVGRTIFDTISNIVDRYFNQYIRIGSNIQPYLAHYNDGITTNHTGWLSQWGSKDLGDQGYTSLQIVRYYYGNSANLYTAPIYDNYPTSFPGYNLSNGACGQEIQHLQNQLNNEAPRRKQRGIFTALSGLLQSKK
jgi:hypothetical protein